MIALWLAAGLALAQSVEVPMDPPAEADPVDRPPSIPDDAERVPLRLESADEPDDEDSGPDLTIVVIGEQQVRAARDEVVRAMETLGWKSRRKSDGRVVFRGPEPWMGKMILSPNGLVDFTTPAIAWGGSTGVDVEYQDTPRNPFDPQTGAAGASLGFDGKKKAQAVQAEIRAEVGPALEEYQTTIRRRGFGRTLEDLPGRLDALWTAGEGLDGSTVSDPAARRAQVLDYWASRTDTPEGRAVCRTIEIWLRETVMTSSDPVTPEEAEAAEGRRTDGRRLDVF